MLLSIRWLSLSVLPVGIGHFEATIGRTEISRMCLGRALKLLRPLFSSVFASSEFIRDIKRS